MKGRKVKSRSVTDVFDNVTEEHRPDQQQDADDMSMEEAARDFAEGERVVRLYRTSETFGGRPKLLGGVPREDFNELNIQETFGGGRYFGRWKKKDGTYIRYTFDVAGPQKDPFEKPEPRPVDPHAPVGFLKSSQRDEDEDEPLGRGGMSAIELFKIMAEVRRESREEMLMILDRLKPGPPPPDTSAQVFSLVEKLVPLIQGGDGGGNPVLSTLMTFREPIAELVSGITAALKGTAKPAEPVTPVPTGKRLEPRPPQEPPKPGPQPEQSEEAMLIESFREYLPMMVRAASLGGEVELYRDLILEQVPVFGYDRLRTWLLKPGCLDDLAKLNNAIYAQQAWWETLRSSLVEALNEELGGHGVRSIQPEPGADPSGSGPTPRDPAA